MNCPGKQVKTKAVPQFPSWNVISAPYIKDMTDAFLAKDFKLPFISGSCWPRLTIVEQNRTPHCLLQIKDSIFGYTQLILLVMPAQSAPNV